MLTIQGRQAGASWALPLAARLPVPSAWPLQFSGLKEDLALLQRLTRNQEQLNKQNQEKWEEARLLPLRLAAIRNPVVSLPGGKALTGFDLLMLVADLHDQNKQSWRLKAKTLAASLVLTSYVATLGVLPILIGAICSDDLSFRQPMRDFFRTAFLKGAREAQISELFGDQAGLVRDWIKSCAALQLLKVDKPDYVGATGMVTLAPLGQELIQSGPEPTLDQRQYDPLAMGNQALELSPLAAWSLPAVMPDSWAVMQVMREAPKPKRLAWFSIAQSVPSYSAIIISRKLKLVDKQQWIGVQMRLAALKGLGLIAQQEDNWYLTPDGEQFLRMPVAQGRAFLYQLDQQALEPVVRLVQELRTRKLPKFFKQTAKDHRGLANQVLPLLQARLEQLKLAEHQTDTVERYPVVSVAVQRPQGAGEEVTSDLALEIQEAVDQLMCQGRAEQPTEGEDPLARIVAEQAAEAASKQEERKS